MSIVLKGGVKEGMKETAEYCRRRFQNYQDRCSNELAFASELAT